MRTTRPRLLSASAASAAQHPAASAARSSASSSSSRREVNRDLDFPDADLIIACDGLNSPDPRSTMPTVFQPDMLMRPQPLHLARHQQDVRRLHLRFPARPSTAGSRPTSTSSTTSTSTFIVETHRGGLSAPTASTRWTRQGSIAFCEKLFAEVPRRRDADDQCAPSARLGLAQFQPPDLRQMEPCSTAAVHVVLMGDAAHTAHFAIGSGTKLALEDAIELAQAVRAARRTPDKIPAVLDAYEEVRARRCRAHPECRAQRHGMVRGGRPPLRRHAGARAVHVFAADALAAHQPREPAPARQGLAGRLRALVRPHAPACLSTPTAASPPPMFTPYPRARARRCRTASSCRRWRCIRPTTACRTISTSCISARARMGGAGLVFGEMTCVSPDARITPGCLGLWNDEQAAAWKRIVDFVHATRRAKVGMQLGHAGRKGSTQVAWEGIDQPLDDGRLAADLGRRPCPICRTARCRARWTRDDMDRVQRRFRRAPPAAPRTTGFDWLELHCAHGYLLSSFLSPLTNRRDGRIRRQPREPRALSRSKCSARCAPSGRSDKPMSVRLSCHDWIAGRQHAGRCGDLRPDVQGGRRRPDRLLVGPGLEGREAGLWPPVPDAVLRPDPQRGRHPDRSPSARSPRPITPTRSSPPAAPISAPSRGRISPIRPGRCTKPPRSAWRTSPGPSSTAGRARRNTKPTSPARRAAASERDARRHVGRLAGRHALVTGAGSGIGAAIADGARGGRRARDAGWRACATALDRAAATLKRIAARHGVVTLDVDRTIRSVERGLARRPRAAWPARHPGQQCRGGAERALRAHYDGGLAGDARRQSHGRLYLHPGGDPGHGGARVRARDQHREQRRPHRLSLCGGLCRRQAWRDRPHPRARRRIRQERRHRERSLPRLHRHAAAFGRGRRRS